MPVPLQLSPFLWEAVGVDVPGSDMFYAIAGAITAATCPIVQYRPEADGRFAELEQRRLAE